MSREASRGCASPPAQASAPSPAPVFAEPWQARAFALMLELRDRGHFTAAEWSTALGKALREPADAGPAAENSNDYNHWLTALESLVMSKGLTDRQSLLVRKEAWADAYRRTPHGKPVELG